MIKQVYNITPLLLYFWIPLRTDIHHVQMPKPLWRCYVSKTSLISFILVFNCGHKLRNMESFLFTAVKKYPCVSSHLFPLSLYLRAIITISKMTKLTVWKPREMGGPQGKVIVSKIWFNIISMNNRVSYIPFRILVSLFYLFD